MMKPVTLILIILFMSGCVSSPIRQEKLRTREITPAAINNTANYLGAPLSSGQIVVCEARGPLSFLFSLFLTRFSPFVHTGILVIEDGIPYVYEARGGIKLLPGDKPPTDAIKGHIKRRKLDWFLRWQYYTAIYNPPEGTAPEKITNFVLEQYAAKRPFDPYFNADDRESVYCTEFVALALEAGGAPPVPLTPIRSANASLAVVLKWLKISASGFILSDSMISPERHVATFSRWLTPKELRLYQAAKRELHTRFTNDQRLGNVFLWTDNRLKFRREVKFFLKCAVRLYPDENDISMEAANSAVHTLANSMFGPVVSYVSLTPSR